jgi:hypothetical protein
MQQYSFQSRAFWNTKTYNILGIFLMCCMYLEADKKKHECVNIHLINECNKKITL